MDVSPATLGILLSKTKGFVQHNAKLEQHETPSEIAARFLFAAQHDIKNKTVADFGCGTGRLTLGACIAGAKKVLAVDIDEQATTILKQNVAKLPQYTFPINIIHTNILHDTSMIPQVDTIVMNPPFGTKQKGADTLFLAKALQHAPIVWSMHKTTTLAYVQQFVEKHNATITYTKNIQFPIDNTHESHTRKKYPVEVTIIRVEHDRR